MKAYVKALMDCTNDSIRIIHTPSLQAKSMFYYIQEVGHFYALPQYYTERKDLQSFLVVYTLSGTGYLTYRDVKYTLLPGQVFFIDCMDYQYYRTDAKQLWELIWVHFDGAASRHYFEQYVHGGDPVRHVGVESIIPGCIQKLIDLYQEKAALTEAITSLIMTELLTELLIHPQGNSKEASIPSYVTNACRYMDEHYQDKVSLAILAKQMTISKFHLAREFKRFTGMTPNQYLIAIRMNKAKELLMYSNQSISWIAANSGFDYVSHFILQFKKLEGTTPLSFRKKWQSPV
jgi:AraC-like DNA-binding protein